MTLCCLLLATAACSTDAIPTAPSGPEQNRLVATVSIKPSDLVIAPDETFQLSAVVKGARGQVVNGRTVTWSSSDESVVRIDPSGSIFAGREGTATLRANVEGVVGVATVDVRGEVIRIEVEAPSTSFHEGEKRQLSGTYVYRNGARRPSGALMWTASDPRILHVDGDGLARARRPGAISIVGYGRGKAGTLDLRVLESDESTISTSASEVTLEVGEDVQLWAEVLNEDGNRLSRPVKWSSSDPSVATVDDEGLVTGISVGNATVTAKSGPTTADVGVTVVESSGTDGSSSDDGSSDGGSSDNGSSGDDSTVTTSSTTSLPGTVTNLGDDSPKTTYNSVSLYFTQVDDGTGSPADYVVRYLDGSIEGQWSEASDVTKGTCAVPLQGTSIGSQLSCTVDGLTASTDYEFQVAAFRGTLGQDAVYGELSNIEGETTAAAPLVVDVVPSAFEVEEEETKQLSATVTDVYGNAVSSSVAWSSSSSAVATVNSSGLVSAQGAGSATIKASAEGASDESDATVIATSSSDDGGTSDSGSSSGEGGANEPSGFTKITERPFDAREENGWTWTGGSDIRSDNNAPRSAPNAGRMDYGAGMTGGVAPAKTQLTGWSSEHIYVQFWFKVSSNFQGHDSGVNKILFFFGGGSEHAVPIAFGRDSDNLYFRLTATGGAHDPNVGTANIVRGQWHVVEMIMKMNTGGNFDGELDVWFDGKKTHQYTNVKYANSDQAHRFDDIRWNPTWGGVGDTVEETMYMWMDHIYMSGK